MTTPARIEKTLAVLGRTYRNPGAMEVGPPFRTLVAVVLSARTRDEQVLKLLPAFFKAFPTPVKLAKASEADIRARIDTIGMYRQKAKHLKQLAQRLCEAYGGEVPRTMEELVTLAGVGRKTASVVLVACFGKPAVAVDTHVHRVVNRLGWVEAKTPEKTEATLLALVPRRLMRKVNRVFVKFGRSICIPGRPRCWACPVRDLCDFKKKNLTPPKDAEAVLAAIERREDALEALRRAVAL